MADKWKEIANQWKQFSGEAQKKWASLTEEELIEINGSRETLVEILQKKYRMDKKEANKQANVWAAKLKV